jgi:hypothetical protein
VVSEDLGEEGVGSCFFSCSIRSVEDHMLNHVRNTGKSEVSASCPSTSVI